MRLYNTLTRTIEPFEPMNPPQVRFYVCGVTVYGEVHLGHARCYITWDMVRRYLEYKGYDVQYVQNFTDVDDKIINKAREEGIGPRDVANRYVERYMADMQALNVKPAVLYPRVTESVPQIIAFIQTLIDKGLAYATAAGDVYYAVRQFAEYGKLSGRAVDDLRSGARVEPGEQKRDPLDFALWKAAKPGEESWAAPWGAGRPGWHIECSAMVEATMGPTIDIHAGGLDLIFPHHENEIAQSEGAHGAPLARYWMHNGLVAADGEKMSKSLGNIKAVRDLLKFYDADTLRFFILQKHYRRPVDLTEDALDAAKTGLSRLKRSLAELEEAAGGSDKDQGVQLEAAVGQGLEAFEAAMNDDFDTPRAIAAIFDLVRQMHQFPKAPHKAINQGTSLARRLAGVLGLQLLAEAPEIPGYPEPVVHFLTQLRAARPDDTAGLDALIDRARTEDAQSVLQAVIELRKAAKANKDWGLADLIRDGLKRDAGILLEDKPGGETRWRLAEPEASRS